MNVDMIDLNGKNVGSLSLPGHIFDLEPRPDILHRVVRWQLAKRRAGTHKSKGRSEISRTGAKMYKQKGTGRARHSSARVSQFRGGGKAHGPVVRSHAHDLPKKLRAAGLRHALSIRARGQALIVMDRLGVEDMKTRLLALRLNALGLSNALFVDGPVLEQNFFHAAANIFGIDVLPIQGINVYDILRRKVLVLSQSAVKSLEERFK